MGANFQNEAKIAMQKPTEKPGQGNQQNGGTGTQQNGGAQPAQPQQNGGK